MSRYREIVAILFDEGVLGGRGKEVREYAEAEFAAAGEESRAQARENARRIRRTVERLGPTFIKAGQLLSTRHDLIGPELASELASLKDDVPTLPFDQMRPLIESEIGGRVEDRFDLFDPEPIASASIAQVYAARLHDGTDVVVKAQRPGVADTMAADLDIMNRTAARLTRRQLWAEDIGLEDIVAEMTARLADEIDYREEARSMERFRADFAGDKAVYFPKPYPELSGSRALVMERIDGIPGTDIAGLDAAGVDRRKLTETGVECYLTQFFETGFFHADPHEGNIFAMPDGRVAFLDFGRVAYLNELDRMRALRLIAAIGANDAPALTETLTEVAHARDDVRTRELQADLEGVLGAYSVRRRSGESGLIEFSQELLGAMRAQRIVMPARMVWILSTIGVLEGVASTLSPGYDTVEAVRSRLMSIMQKQVTFEDMSQLLQRWGVQYWQTLDELPLATSRIMRRAAEGEFAIAVRPQGYDRLVDRIEEIANRLVFAIIALGLIIATTAYATTFADELSDTILLVIVGFVLLLLAVWMWRARKRRRRRDHEERLRSARR
jgi:ubiquinone biosynthesis protein